MASNTLQIKVVGAADFARKLAKIEKDISDLVEPLKEAGQIAKAAVKSYPPYTNSWKTGTPSFIRKRPGSKYVRTGALQKSWNGRLQKKGKAPSYIVYQKTSMNQKEKMDARDYMPYVQGAEQTAIHSAYWNTLDTWTEILEPIVSEIVGDYVTKLVK